MSYLRAQAKVHEVFSHSTASNRVKTKRKPNTNFFREHLAVKTEMKIKTKLILSKQLSTKKPHDMVSTAEWQFCNIIKVFCNYSCWRLRAKSSADIDAYMNIIYKFPLKTQENSISCLRNILWSLNFDSKEQICTSTCICKYIYLCMHMYLYTYIITHTPTLDITFNCPFLPVCI